MVTCEDKLTIKHWNKTKVKTITVKNSKNCKKKNSKKRRVSTFTQRNFQVKMNKKTLFEYKCTKQILRDLNKTLLNARNICTQCHVNSLARTESFWVFSPGFSSLINNISNIKQSNFVLHFLKSENCLSFKSDFDSPWSSKWGLKLKPLKQNASLIFPFSLQHVPGWKSADAVLLFQGYERGAFPFKKELC